MPRRIEGVVVPVLTPMDEDGHLVPSRVADSVEYSLHCGAHAIVASGTGVQETSTLAPEERKRLVTETVEAVDGRVPVLAGISYPAQPVVSELIDHAEAEGADAVLAMPPWGVPPSQGAIVRYFETIAGETDLPILVYNNPTVTVDMPTETMAEVARLDGVAYVKESSRDWAKVSWLLEHVHHAGHADVLATMDVLLPTLQAGGAGIITPAPLSVPSMAIYEAFERGDLEAAAETQRVFGRFPPEEVDTGLIGVCKAATRIAGVDVGPPRPPYDRLDDAGRSAIDEWMDEVGVPRR